MKENGFAIGLLAATLVVGGGLLAFGVMQGKKYNENLAAYQETEREVSKMLNTKPYPSEANCESRKTEITEFRGQVEGLQKALENYRPETLEKITSNEFQDRLVLAATEVTNLFKSKEIEYPGNFAFGMEQYTDNLADPGATGELDFQLKAFAFMFKELAALEPYKIGNFRRESLPSEKGQNWLELLPKGEDEELQIAQEMPFELTFLATEATANEFINKLSTNGSYYFSIDAMRIAAEVQDAPNRAMSGLEEEETAADEDDPGSGFADAFAAFGDDDAKEEGGEEKEEAPEDDTAETVDTGKILGQIAGPGQVGDGVWVGLQLRLYLFTDTVEIPEFN